MSLTKFIYKGIEISLCVQFGNLEAFGHHSGGFFPRFAPEQRSPNNRAGLIKGKKMSRHGIDQKSLAVDYLPEQISPIGDIVRCGLHIHALVVR